MLDGDAMKCPRLRRNPALWTLARSHGRRGQHLQLRREGLQPADRCSAGTPAAALQQYSVKIVEVIIKHGGGVRGGKAIMRLMGVNCGSCRLPPVPSPKPNTPS